MNKKQWSIAILALAVSILPALTPGVVLAFDEACTAKTVCVRPQETCTIQSINDACTKTGCTVSTASSCEATTGSCTVGGDGDGDGDVLPGGDGDGDGEAGTTKYSCQYT